MQLLRSLVLAAGFVSLMPTGSPIAQQADRPLKIGVLSDLSSVYSDIGGMGNVEATKMAIEEFGGSMFGAPIELLTADPQNKPDTAAAIVRKNAEYLPGTVEFLNLTAASRSCMEHWKCQCLRALERCYIRRRALEMIS